MELETPLTPAGREGLQKVAEYDSWGYDTAHEAVPEELGGSYIRSCAYTFPCVHKGRKQAEPGHKETYVLKICDRCCRGIPLGSQGHTDCFIDNEVMIWKEAVRRGDDSLFCPIVAADRDQGWMLMEHCDPLDTLVSPNQLFDSSEISDRVEETERQLQDRGWRPKSIKRMDFELMVLDRRVVAIDYENLYHKDWMFDPHYWRWSECLRWDTPYTAMTEYAIEEHRRKISDIMTSSRFDLEYRRLLDELHYTTVMSLSKLESTAREKYGSSTDTLDNPMRRR